MSPKKPRPSRYDDGKDECARCEGTGRYQAVRCPDCDGTGRK